MARDDLGTSVPVGRPATRVVSLVPSLTEALAATRPEALVGATDWCTHPAGLDVRRVRGTKNPDLAAIREVRPDLVVANQEENRRIDVERLRGAGLAVWVTVIEDVPGAIASMGRLFTDALAWDRPAWLDEAAEVWSRPAPAERLRVAIPVWRDPWMVVGPRTFTGDLAARLGMDNVFGGGVFGGGVFGADDLGADGLGDAAPKDGQGRYPHVDGPSAIEARRPDMILLPDEPYPFGPADGPEAFAGTPTVCVPGRLLTWYGPSLVGAREQLRTAVSAAR